ncbi:DUF6238 family protein [Streptomyces carpaticus]|uniref:DUF6238 family protein n=1 Tax=Streptomyces carpaticus TaxID=285558 RepID=A0ABV4ZGV2_9ACTN
MPSISPPDTGPDLVAFATAALDFHRAVNVAVETGVADRSELDSLHAHLLCLYGLFDALANRTAPVAKAEGDHLRAARVRSWQAAEHLHAAFHTAPRKGSPESNSELTVCQRHLRTAVLVRRQTTSADLRAQFTGLTRHRGDLP